MYKKTMLLIVIVTLLFCIFYSSYVKGAGVEIYPGVNFYQGDLTFSVSNTIESGHYFEMGDNYLRFDNYNLSIVFTGSLHINASAGVNNTHNYFEKNAEILSFNATYSKSDDVIFKFKGNHSNMVYNLYRDNIFRNKYYGNFSWTENSWSAHSYSIQLDGIYPDPPYNGSSNYTSTSNTVNLTWTSGNYSDFDVVVMNTENYPTSPIDGTVYQNSTQNYYNFTVNSSSGYFTIWSYNDTTDTYSLTGLDIPWGALIVNVFNASKTWERVDPYGIIIQNVDGTQIHRETTASNPVYLDITDLPVGDLSVFVINASRYETQTYRRDTLLNTFQNYTFLLPPFETYVGEDGGGDLDPVTGEPTNETSTQIYLITVYNEVDQTLQDALVTINLYVNSTDTYEQIGSFITDGAGQGTINLIPEKLYQVVITTPNSDDYLSNTTYWTPSNAVYTKSFKLKYTEDETQPSYYINDYITINVSRTNTTLTIYYLDELSQTLNLTIYVYEINGSTGIESLFHSNHTTNISGISYTTDGLNSTNHYKIVFIYNHTTFGYQDPTYILNGYRFSLSTAEEFNKIMTDVFGPNPLVWSHVLLFCVLVVGMFFADPKDAGKVLILIGGIFIFINIILSYEDALATAGGGIIPGLFILVGIMVEWKGKKGD